MPFCAFQEGLDRSVYRTPARCIRLEESEGMRRMPRFCGLFINQIDITIQLSHLENTCMQRIYCRVPSGNFSLAWVKNN
jgi:hypothetical protein